ncbi:hypothetical protein [Streptomyces sp. NPDC101166]|uniref:hypothetical protein n=1 Tax=Streptomyces sp. NPDC101166 TaxID=3366120 RepID=UPI00382787B8
MPRRRPGRIRAGSFRSRRTRGAEPAIDGLSARALRDISRLEHTRNYLQSGHVSAAVRRWKDYVHRPERQLWHDYEWGDAHDDCCGDPLQARALLDTVMQALPRRSARELRQIISRADAVLQPPSPPRRAV